MTALRSDVWDFEAISLRVGLIGAGMLLFDTAFTLWHQAEPGRSPWGLGLLLLANILGLALMTLALTRRLLSLESKSQLSWLVLVGVLLVSLMRLYAFKSNFYPTGPVQTDTGMITGYASEGLARGQNPYDWNFGDFLRVYRASPLYVTPHFDGTIQNKAAYPALTYWLFWGAGRLGLSVPTTTFICLIVMLILLYITAPTTRRPLVLLPMVIFEEYTHSALVGNQDTILSLLLVCMLIVWHRPKWRAICFGLACAFRQQAWFVAPFLLIYIWKMMEGTPAERRQRIAYFVGISGGVFVLINLPFIAWNPQAWWLGVFEHSYAPFNVLSHGLGVLSQYGVFPLPRQFYMALQMASLAAMMVVHWRHPHFIDQAFWIFPALFFWLYYRGLANYWVYWVPPLLYAVVNRPLERSAFEGHAAQHSASWLGTAALAAPLFVAVGIWGVFLAQRSLPIKVNYAAPLEVMSHGQILVNRVKVTVVNESEADFMPRFAVQRDPGVQALPWEIDSGPDVLGPGETGEYVINAGISDRAFPVERGGQIVVTGAEGDYWRRVIRTIPPDRSFADPDLIDNPSFRFWPDDGNAPISWALQTTGNITTSMALETVDGRDALVVKVGAASDVTAPGKLANARLVQSITFPTALTAWVYPPVPSTTPLQSPYGVAFGDGEHRLWVLFGNSDAHAKLDENFGYIYFPAPVKAWSQHVIHLQDLYDLFDWQLPAPSIRRRNGLEYRTRQVQVSLIFPAESQSAFGPIAQESDVDKTEAFWSDTLAHPERYYIQRGDEYRRQRNYDLAQDAYRQAIAYDPTNGESYFGLAEASFWRDDWATAMDAFEKSIAYGCQQPAQAYRGIGWSHYNREEFTQARQAFEESTEIDPDLADAHNGLGWVAVKEQRCDDAVVHFERALALDPNFADPRRGLEACEQP